MMRPADIFAHWRQVRGGLIETIDLFDESELAYVPFPGAFSAAKIMLHIAGAEDGWLRYVAVRELDEWPSDYDPQHYPHKAAIKEKLAQVHRFTERYLESLTWSDWDKVIETPWGTSTTVGWIIWHVLEHEIHHRGELSLILGLLGKEAPDM